MCMHFQWTRQSVTDYSKTEARRLNLSSQTFRHWRQNSAKKETKQLVYQSHEIYYQQKNEYLADIHRNELFSDSRVDTYGAAQLLLMSDILSVVVQ